MKTAFLGIAAAAALALGTFIPAQAQQQEGLVNVNVSDNDPEIGLNVNVQAPVGIAANVCGLAVNALAQKVATGDATCDADADAAASNEQFMRFAERQDPEGAQEIRDAVGG